MGRLIVTVVDVDAGTETVQRVEDDTYLLITAGKCHLDSEQHYPMSGTVNLTLKGVNGVRVQERPAGRRGGYGESRIPKWSLR